MARSKQHSLYMYRTPVQERASRTRPKRSWNGRMTINCPRIILYWWTALQKSGKVICRFVQPLYTTVQVNKVQEVWHSCQYGMFVQVFGSLKDGMEACESCEWGAGLFKGCKRLDLIGGEDPPELMCGNCAYAGDCPCVVGAGEQSPWTMPVQIIYGTAQPKKKAPRRWRRIKSSTSWNTNY